MIYVIESGDYFKVGFTSKDFETKRGKAYNTHNPDWSVVYVVEGGIKDELSLHTTLKRFKSKYRQEWFVKFDGWEYIVSKLLKKEFVDLSSIYFEDDTSPYGFLTPSNNFTVKGYASYKSISEKDALVKLEKDFKSGKCVRLDIYNKDLIYIYHPLENNK